MWKRFSAIEREKKNPMYSAERHQHPSSLQLSCWPCVSGRKCGDPRLPFCWPFKFKIQPVSPQWALPLTGEQPLTQSRHTWPYFSLPSMLVSCRLQPTSSLLSLFQPSQVLQCRAMILFVLSMEVRSTEASSKTVYTSAWKGNSRVLRDGHCWVHAPDFRMSFVFFIQGSSSKPAKSQSGLHVELELS